MEQGQLKQPDELAKELEFRTIITTAMLGTLDLDQILYVILSGITSGDGLGFNRALLFLLDDSGRLFRPKMSLGPGSLDEAHQIWDGINRDQLSLSSLVERFESYQETVGSQRLAQRVSNFSLPIDQLGQHTISEQSLIVEKKISLYSLLANCLHNRSPFASNGINVFHDSGSEKINFQHVAITPLRVADNLIGAIIADNIYSKARVNSEQLRSLYAFGNLAALAIERARLHAKTVSMAEVDGLTGVYNRRYYQEELERNLKLSQRNEQTLSIVIFDLDHFKSYNDKYGHLVGDQLLKEIALILKENVRQSDMVARYGGEEFVVLLANTEPEAAAQVAEKLRERVKASVLSKDKISGLTLSAGVAGSQGEESAEELFERTDQALYQAKRSGRDRVVTWHPGIEP